MAPVLDRLLWTQVSDVGPPPRRWQMMSYDADRDRVVLFGGYLMVLGKDGNPTETPCNDTWEFDGTVWTQVEDSGPPARGEAKMCYDAGRKRTVLYGGAATVNGQGVLYQDTWEWDGALWTQVADTGPPSVGALAYDASHRYVLYFSEENIAQGHPHGATWSWNGVEWTQLDDQGAGNGDPAMAYDATARVTIAITGSAQRDAPTFSWTGAAWKQLGHLGPDFNAAGGAICFDGVEVLLFQMGQGQTWSWNGAAWVQRQDMGPSQEMCSSLVGDTTRKRCVFYAAKSKSDDRPPTWVLRRLPGVG